MDETLHELVSRYLDGDLDDEESALLEGRTRTDSEIAAEIEAARQIRRAVAALAQGMEPPATLDTVMEPLRQSAPAPAQTVRPVYRWLGAAAAVVLGVTVAVEVANRNPSPSLSRPSRQRPAPDREKIFELAPLPSAVPDDNRPLGAADHLLEEELPQPTAPEPAPLEVMGPLPTDGTAKIQDEMLPSSDHRAIPETKQSGETVPNSMDSQAVEPGLPSTGKSAVASSKAPPKRERTYLREDREATPAPLQESQITLDSVAGRPQKKAAGVLLRIDGIEYRTRSSTTCAAGEWNVQIEVRKNVVVGIELVPGQNDYEVGDGCRLEDVVDSILAGVGDGTHLAEIVIQDSAP